MTESYPSRPVINVDVPEVKVFSAKFIYNYFTKDERVNDSGEIDPKILENNVGNFDQKFIDVFDSKIPRFVQINFNPVTITNPIKSKDLTTGHQLSLGARPKDNISIKDNLKSVHSERQFTNEAFTAIGFQDTGIDGKLFLLTSGSMARKINSNNERIKRQIDNETSELIDEYNNDKISLADAVRFLNGNTDDAVSAEFIFDSLNDLSRLGAKFIDKSKKDELINARFKEIKNVDIKSKINNKIVASALKTITSDPLSIFTDEVSGLLASAESSQKQSIRDSEPDSIDSTEYDFTVSFIGRRRVSSLSFVPNHRVIGYIVDKYEIASDGRFVEHEPIVVENESAKSTIDFKVSYGSTYSYSIRSVVDTEILVSDETDEIYAARILISSSPSPRQIVECVENVPPPPPCDFDVSWDHNNKSARLLWSFPLNLQRDIKRFQVFRRSSINEPFQLIKEYDFDNSFVKTHGLETPSANLVERLSSPKTFYLDNELNRDGNKFIYSVCSIDAHGLTSNYSTQFEVQFDRFKNNIKKKLISSSGAPKSYPNMFLDGDTFVDVIKDSGHTRMSIYFDPEYYSITNSETVVRNSIGDRGIPRRRENLNLLATNQNGGSYKMQFINTDLQQSAILDIIVDDRSDEGNRIEERRLGGIIRKPRQVPILTKEKSSGLIKPTNLKIGSAEKPSRTINSSWNLKLGSS